MKAAVDQGVRRDKDILPYSFHIVPEAAFGDTQYDGELVFGNGEDGNVTITSDTSLTEDMYYSNLTIAEGATLNPNGFRVFVKNKLTLNGDLGIKESAGAITSGTLEGTVAAGQNVVDGLGGAGEPDGMVSGYTFTGTGAITGSTTVSPSDFYNLRNAVNGYRQRGSDFIRVKGGAGGGVGADGASGTGADGTYTVDTDGNPVSNATTVGAVGGKGSPGVGGSGGAGARGGGVVMVAAREVEGSGGVYSEGGSGTSGAAGVDGADAPVFNQPDYVKVVAGVPYTVDPAPYVSAEGYWTNPDPSECSNVCATCCIGAVEAYCAAEETSAHASCGTECTGAVDAYCAAEETSAHASCGTQCTGAADAYCATTENIAHASCGTQCLGGENPPCEDCAYAANPFVCGVTVQSSGCGWSQGADVCEDPVCNTEAIESYSWYSVPQPCVNETVHVEFTNPFTGEFIEFDTVVCTAQPDAQERRLDWSIPAGTVCDPAVCTTPSPTYLGACSETANSCYHCWDRPCAECTTSNKTCAVCTDWRGAVGCTTSNKSCLHCTDWRGAVPCTTSNKSCLHCTDWRGAVPCHDVTNCGICGVVGVACPPPTWTDPVITDPPAYSVTPPDTNAYYPPVTFSGGSGGTGSAGQRGGRGGGGVLIMITRNAGTPDYTLNTGINGTLVALDTVNLS